MTASADRAVTVLPNRHGTALVVGRTGLLITGPSGSGKSELALRLLTSALLSGRFAGLVADDQVLIDVRHGRVIARTPPAIAGQIEVRGSGIVRVPHLTACVLHLALAPGEASGADRIPAEGERCELEGGISLPVLRMRYSAQRDPFATLEFILGSL
ncbi:HPr kinase/phosphorylase [Pararhizobium haloflavum]|uniref:HPr kinase/phosphorylase n=1 Tax=Pararhizobium haloflavum TaxID=2037914 RepID=UPI000C1886EC|nr:serine/threonine protein kinase [Pararhizobium haloflavum]